METNSLSHSIVTARNMGLEKHNREQVHIQIEDFLLGTLDLHGLNRSDIFNIAIEQYLIRENYLTESTLSTLSHFTTLDKHIFSKGIF